MQRCQSKFTATYHILIEFFQVIPQISISTFGLYIISCIEVYIEINKEMSILEPCSLGHTILNVINKMYVFFQ